jgi:peptidoglycan/LPS O-acetylase OafA/YrhL
VTLQVHGDQHAGSLSIDHSQQLDSMRALSALIVLVGHANQTILLPTTQSSSSFVGLFTQCAVMVFFVLSGFLIGKSVINNTRRSNGFDLRVYVYDRALRIYPPLIVASVLVVMLAALAPYVFPSGTQSLIEYPGVKFVRSEFVAETKSILGSLAFLNEFRSLTPTANGPLWSLSIEVWYYVIAAAIFAFPRNKVIVMLIVVAVVYVTKKNMLFYMLAPVWFSGFLLAFLHERNTGINNRIFLRLGVLFVLLTMLSAYLIFFVESLGRGVFLDYWNYYRVFSGLTFACLLALILGDAVAFPKIFHKHASYSYTLYVTHFPIMLFVLGVFQVSLYGSLVNSILATFGVIVFSIFLARAVASIAENKRLLKSIFPLNKRSALV